MWWIAPASAGVLLMVFLSVVFGRALAFHAKAQKSLVPEKVALDEEGIVGRFRELIRHKTVSYYDDALEDKQEFERLIESIRRMYPLVHEKCTLSRHGERGLLYRLKGANEGPCTVLMAHFDVVPAEEKEWQKPPFAAIMEDGYIWGRGTLDTKSTFCGILEAAEALLAQNYVPDTDIYFSFAGDEEKTGGSTPSIVNYFKEKNIRIGLVVDEGGAVVKGIFPGVDKPCALIGTAEKGILDLHFSIKSNGGHASAPPPHTIVGELAKAITRIENKRAKLRIPPATKEMFDTLGRYSTFGMKLIFANMWCFRPLFGWIAARAGGELNALVRTTYAFTAMKGSDAANVLPPTAEVTANVRIIPGESCHFVKERAEKIIKNKNISLSLTEAHEPSPCSITHGEGYNALTDAIRECWQDALVSPYLMIASSDAKHFARISDKVYRFSPMFLSKEDRAAIHGNNEKISVESLMTVVRFYTRLMLRR
jgi:carboxypeptidase PM20D1